MVQAHSSRGLFVGLITLDMIYLVDRLPESDQKIVALEYEIAAGGPATNASVAFKYLGNTTTICGELGTHPLATIIALELQQCGILIDDLSSLTAEPPPVSSIMITASSGNRAVVSLNTSKRSTPQTVVSAQSLEGVAVVLIDGHQMTQGYDVAAYAQAKGIPW